MSTSTEGQKRFAHGTSIQAELKIKHHCSSDWRNKLLFSKMQHSKQCREKHEVPWGWPYLTNAVTYVSHVSRCISPYSAFHVSTTKWAGGSFFQRTTLVLFLWQLWKLEFEPLDHTCCCLLKLVQRGWMLGCVCWLPGSFLLGKELRAALLDQLLCLEEAPQVKHLPRSQPNETAHGEYAEVQYACVGGL